MELQVGAGPSNRNADFPKPYSMETWQDRAGTAGSHGDMGPGAVMRRNQAGLSHIASPRALSVSHPTRLRSLTTPLEIAQSTFSVWPFRPSPSVPGAFASPVVREQCIPHPGGSLLHFLLARGFAL